jgi:hypothetical protein
MSKYPTDREMTPVEFANVMDDIIREMAKTLPDLARRFFDEQGRGAISFHLHDAPVARDRRMGIGYTKPEQLPNHKYLKRLTEEYDPDGEVVLFCTTKNRKVQVIRHLYFSELRDGQ